MGKRLPNHQDLCFFTSGICHHHGNDVCINSNTVDTLLEIIQAQSELLAAYRMRRIRAPEKSLDLLFDHRKLVEFICTPRGKE